MRSLVRATAMLSRASQGGVGGPREEGRLSALDAAFLYFERPNQLLHLGCVIELDGTVDPAALAAHLAARLSVVPRYGQRLLRVPLELGRPRWVSDPTFDPRRHLAHVAVPAPGGAREVRELVGALFSTPLNPGRPLWEAFLVDGLPGRRAAVLCKAHHSVMDGVSGVQILELLTDPSPRVSQETGSTGEPPEPPEPPDDGADGAGGSAPTGAAPRRAARAPSSDTWRRRGRPDELLRAVSGSLAAGFAPKDVIEALRAVTGLLARPAPALPFNGPLGNCRRMAWVSLPLDDLLAVREDAGCKLNDVILAIVAGALRRHLADRGVATKGLHLRVGIPVSVRPKSDDLGLGNLLTVMLPSLPLDAASPVERLRRVAAETVDLKRRGQPRAMGLMLALLGALPPPLEAAAAMLVPDRLVVNSVCTNVPGPREPRYLLGRRVHGVHGIVPLFQRIGLAFTAVSYADRLSICVSTDPDLVPDLEALEMAIKASAAELCAALRVPPPLAARAVKRAAPFRFDRAAALAAARGSLGGGPSTAKPPFRFQPGLGKRRNLPEEKGKRS